MKRGNAPAAEVDLVASPSAQENCHVVVAELCGGRDGRDGGGGSGSGSKLNC